MSGISAISPNGRYTMPTAIPIALLMTTAGNRLRRSIFLCSCCTMIRTACPKAKRWNSKPPAILPKRILHSKARFHRLASSLSKIIPQLNRAIKYIPYVLSRAAGAPGRSSPKGGAGREDGANQHQRRKRPHGKGCRPRHAYGYDDTCAGYTSQSRAPRHGNGGRHVNLWSDLARRRLRCL